MVEYIITKMKKEIAEYTKSDSYVTVVATGGMASLMATGINLIDHVDKLLTLTGLELIYEKNQPVRRAKKKNEGDGE